VPLSSVVQGPGSVSPKCFQGPRRQLTHSSHEAKGISRIFTHREEEYIIHTPTITEELPKGEKPDRVYGLRETRNFDVALQKQVQLDATQDGPDGSNKLVLDLVKVSPYSLDGDRLLFPFLFLEAKSGKSSDDWDSIKLQTCFPIRTALEVQRGLQLANGAKSRWKAGPLIWFLMSKGEDWRLCSAFTEEKGHNHQNGGEITYVCGSLSLHLIVKSRSRS
jgi:hypothetical protein